MSRGTDYLFIPTDPDDIITWMTELYEGIMNVSVKPASPEELFIHWMSHAIVIERVLTNYAANQNIPSRAVGDNLDALAELTYIGARPAAKAATCTMRFTISEAQAFAVLVPKGTRVTDAKKTLYWETPEDAYIPAGETYTDVENVVCQSVGTEGNGWELGEIDYLVDPFIYSVGCENVTESEGGSDVATDEEFYELMRASMDAFSTAGATGSYRYWAMQVSNEIADVCPNSPWPGVCYLYVLMNGGYPAGEEMKKKVYDACSADDVRPFTDHVFMGDPELVEYNIDLTYYLYEDSTTSAAEIEEKVNAAVQEYIEWQYARLGRDINPSKLQQLIMDAGVKRVDIRAPVFTPLRNGELAVGETYDDYLLTVPQVASLAGEAVVLNGGYEDE